MQKYGPAVPAYKVPSPRHGWACMGADGTPTPLHDVIVQMRPACRACHHLILIGQARSLLQVVKLGHPGLGLLDSPRELLPVGVDLLPAVQCRVRWCEAGQDGRGGGAGRDAHSVW